MGQTSLSVMTYNGHYTCQSCLLGLELNYD
jgi:hypothetical protein